MMNSSLADAVFWIAVMACAVAQVGILRATRAERAARGKLTPTHRPATRVEEAAWAVLPAVALAVILLLTWRAVHERSATVSAPLPAAVTAGGAA